MSNQQYIDGGYIDLDRDEHGLTVNGERLTEERAQQAADAALERFERRRGRPSLSESGERSPALSVRFPTPIKQALAERAESEGVSEAELVRRAVTNMLNAS